MCETTKKNSWVDKDLRKSPKRGSVLKRTELCRMLKRTEPLKTGWKKSEGNSLSQQKKKEKKKKRERKRPTLKRQSKCHVFVKQVCFSYGESPRTPPLEGTSLHRRNIIVERPWGILSLFTTCLLLWVKSSRQSRCHVSPTQELIVCILRRQSLVLEKEISIIFFFFKAQTEGSHTKY